MTNATEIINDARQYQTKEEEFQNPRPPHVLRSFLKCNETKSLGHIYGLSYIRKKKKKSQADNLNWERGGKQEEEEKEDIIVQHTYSSF